MIIVSIASRVVAFFITFIFLLGVLMFINGQTGTDMIVVLVKCSAAIYLFIYPWLNVSYKNNLFINLSYLGFAIILILEYVIRLYFGSHIDPLDKIYLNIVYLASLSYLFYEAKNPLLSDKVKNLFITGKAE